MTNLCWLWKRDGLLIFQDGGGRRWEQKKEEELFSLLPFGEEAAEEEEQSFRLRSTLSFESRSSSFSALSVRNQPRPGAQRKTSITTKSQKPATFKSSKQIVRQEFPRLGNHLHLLEILQLWIGNSRELSRDRCQRKPKIENLESFFSVGKRGNFRGKKSGSRQAARETRIFHSHKKRKKEESFFSDHRKRHNFYVEWLKNRLQLKLNQDWKIGKSPPGKWRPSKGLVQIFWWWFHNPELQQRLGGLDRENLGYRKRRAPKPPRRQ